MEAQRVSKKAALGGAAASSAFDDVFGGPPKFLAPFSARMHDYAEIFGAAASACSIPFLDLPPAMDGFDGEPAAPRRSSGFDYFEVFGGLDFGELAVSYEELFAVPRRVEVGASGGRALDDPAINDQDTEEYEYPLEDMHEDHKACREEDYVPLSSNSNHSDHGLKQSNLSYDRASPISKEGAFSGKTHITDLPEFHSTLDTIVPLQTQTSDAACCMVYGDKNDGKLQSKFMSNSSTHGLEISRDEFTGDQKKSTIESPILDIDHANLKYCSQSASSDSVASDDASSSNTIYVSVSNISLRTQPLRVPPPSRPPPKTVSKKENPFLKACATSRISLDGRSLCKPNENSEEHYISVSSASHACQDADKNIPCFFDVNVDASSAAAAMKQAMELAQARLRTAKESMEKKRINLQSHKKLGQQESNKERRVDQTFIEGNFSEMLTQKSIVKEDKHTDVIASKERNRITNGVKASEDVAEAQRYVVFDQQIMQGNNLRSEKDCGKWRMNQEHHELLSNEKNYKMVEGVSDQEGNRKKTKATANIIEDIYAANKEAILPSELESTGILKEESDGSKNDTNLQDDNVAYKKQVIEEIENATPKFCLHENVDDLQKAHVSSSGENEKHGKAHEVCDGGMRIPYAIENTISERSENNRELSEGNEFQGIHDSKEGNWKSKAGKEAFECEENFFNLELIRRSSEDKLNSETCKDVLESADNADDRTVADASCEPCESKKKLNVSMISSVPNGGEIKMPIGSCVFEAGKGVSATSECSEFMEKTGEEQVEYDHAENLDRMEESGLGNLQEVREEPYLKQELCMSGKNESELKVSQSVDELGENLKKLNATGVIMSGEQEKPMKAIEAACLKDCTGIKVKDSQVEEQQSDKIQEATRASCMQANSGNQDTCQANHEMRENEEIRKIHVKPDFSYNSNILSSIPDVSGKPLFVDLGVQQETLSERRCDILESTQNARENYNVESERIDFDMKKTEEKENERMERERKWAEVEASKLEEEKEREREREKDRVAVERATREAHKRAFAEARERAERIAVEKVTAEARQRALKEAREKAEKASVLSMEKSLAEKASREAKLRAERAAVQRATAEARERAAERALAEKATADARDRAERSNGIYKDRMSKQNIKEDHISARNKDDYIGAHLQSTSSSSNYRKYSALINQSNGESALRCKARLERHQRTAERVAKALAEKNMRDIFAQREQAERNRLAEYLDADVKRWSNGKQGNLRALLSTLQYILGPESGWQPISLTDVITAAAVKKAYRKATLCVHPDKLQQRGASIQQKYICEKVFDLLKEAWNKFNSEER
uniref:J domain-containing protein n=1 Tax=Musa acuminata subsp. malaccensis TaxID=214687 RepID=A0A804K0C6_MUSAM|nr:PREDICTED: auxilin-like protein 1 isoform X2 [Musa acuminata subsp. malaccensis]